MKIDRYNGVVLDGKGYIKDHLLCRDVIIFDFGMADDELAKNVLIYVYKNLMEKIKNG